MTHLALIDEIRKLPPERRLELIDEIYETLDATPIALTPEQEAELKRRIQYYEKHPEKLVPLALADERLDRRLSKP